MDRPYYEYTKGELRDEIARLQADVKEAEQRGYAKAMEAERFLYDNSLRIVWNDAIEAALTVIMDDNVDDTYIAYEPAIRALRKETP